MKQNLVWNYCSQVDRLFTYEEMLKVTGLSNGQAKRPWKRLINDGRIIEVKGADVPAYRYLPRSMPRHRIVQARNEMIRAIYRSIQEGNVTPGAIAGNLGTTRQNVHLYLRILEKSGGVRRPHPGVYEVVDATVISVGPVNRKVSHA